MNEELLWTILRALHAQRDTLNYLCERINTMSQTLSTEETAINTSIGNLTAAVTNSTTEITSLAGSITSLLNSNNGTLSPQDTATLSGFATSIQAAADGLNASVSSVGTQTQNTAKVNTVTGGAATV